MHAYLLDVGERVLDGAGEGVLRNGRSSGRRLDGLLSCLVDAVALEGGDLDDPASDLVGELLYVDPVAVFADKIHHVESYHHRDAELDELSGKIEVPLKVGAVDDVEDDVGALVNEIISGDYLLQSVRREGIDSRKVGDDDVLVIFDAPFLLLDGDSRPVSDELVGAGERVE